MSDSFATSWTIVCQALLSMGFPRQEYCSRWPFPSPGDLPHPRIEPLYSAWQVDSLPLSFQGSLSVNINIYEYICIAYILFVFTSVQFSSVTQSCPTLGDPMNQSTPGLPVHHQLPEFTQTHVHWVSDAIQPSHALLSPSPPAPNPSQHQSLFQWVNSSHEVDKVLEFQL